MATNASKAVLVAGSTGYVGRYVVRELAERGFRVRALTRSEERLGEPGPFDAPAVRDACDDVAVAEGAQADTLAPAFEGIDAAVIEDGTNRMNPIHGADVAATWRSSLR